MKINVVFKHVNPSDEVKDYVSKRFDKIKKYVDYPIDVKVIISSEKFRYKAEAIVSANGIRTAAREEQQDIFSAIDLLSDKIESQLKKFKEKQIDRNREQKYIEKAPETTTTSDIILHVERIDKHPISIDDALERLQSGTATFVPFINKDSNQLNILYWREDGTLGIYEL